MICCGSPQKEQLKAEEEEDHDSDSQTVCAGVQTEDNLQSLKVKPNLSDKNCSSFSGLLKKKIEFP